MQLSIRSHRSDYTGVRTEKEQGRATCSGFGDAWVGELTAQVEESGQVGPEKTTGIPSLPLVPGMKFGR